MAVYKVFICQFTLRQLCRAYWRLRA